MWLICNWMLLKQGIASKENYAIGMHSRISRNVICPLLTKYFSMSCLKVTDH